MRKVILYIAMSLDGYIADCRKSVDWIKGQDDSVEMKDTYLDFFANVGTVIMGRRTYEQITTELSPMADTEDIRFTDDEPCRLINNLKEGTGKNIWICGGADVIKQFMKEDLIDRFHIAMIPVVLGGGIRLFEEIGRMINLTLVDTLNYNGVVEVVYDRRKVMK